MCNLWLKLRAYVNYKGEHSWQRTLVQLNRSILLKVHLDTCPDFLVKGGQHAAFVADGVAARECGP